MKAFSSGIKVLLKKLTYLRSTFWRPEYFLQLYILCCFLLCNQNPASTKTALFISSAFHRPNAEAYFLHWSDQYLHYFSNLPQLWSQNGDQLAFSGLPVDHLKLRREQRYSELSIIIHTFFFLAIDINVVFLHPFFS